MPEQRGCQGPTACLAMPRGSTEGDKKTRRATVSSKGPEHSLTSAFGIFQLFLAPSPCSLASCHFSGSCCQNCRRRLLWGSAQLQACTPLNPHPIHKLGMCCPNCQRELPQPKSLKLLSSHKSDQSTMKLEFLPLTAEVDSSSVHSPWLN